MGPRRRDVPPHHPAPQPVLLLEPAQQPHHRPVPRALPGAGRQQPRRRRPQIAEVRQLAPRHQQLQIEIEDAPHLRRLEVGERQPRHDHVVPFGPRSRPTVDAASVPGGRRAAPGQVLHPAGRQPQAEIRPAPRQLLVSPQPFGEPWIGLHHVQPVPRPQHPDQPPRHHTRPGPHLQHRERPVRTARRRDRQRVHQARPARRHRARRPERAQRLGQEEPPVTAARSPPPGPSGRGVRVLRGAGGGDGPAAELMCRHDNDARKSPTCPERPKDAPHPRRKSRVPMADRQGWRTLGPS